MENTTLKRSVTRSAAIFLVISAVVGSGVFKKIAPMAETLHSPVFILLCWAVAGLLSLAGALCTAELASMMPGSGGEFVYFKRIYGRFFAFLYGWGNLTVMKSATVAALAYIFAQSFNALVPLPQTDFLSAGADHSAFAIKVLATLLVIFLSFINYRGVTFSANLSRYLIIGIILVMIGFVFSALGSQKGETAHFAPSTLAPTGWALFTAFFGASLSAFWGYEGWNNIGYLGEEVKEPQKNIPRALITGTLFVMFLYLAVNAAYLYVLPIEDLAAINQEPSKIAAVEVAGVITGPAGAIVLSTLILLSTFNCTNTTILTSSRIFYAMSRDGLFLKSTGKIHHKYQTPFNAILMQGVWALVLLWWGSFDQLTDLLIFAAFIFYAATALGVIIMRVKSPEAPRPYKLNGYPFLPAIFALFCVSLVVVTVIQTPMQSLIGLLLIFSGVPVYWYYKRKKLFVPLEERHVPPIK